MNDYAVNCKKKTKGNKNKLKFLNNYLIYLRQEKIMEFCIVDKINEITYNNAVTKHPHIYIKHIPHYLPTNQHTYKNKSLISDNSLTGKHVHNISKNYPYKILTFNIF